ncbi:MAG: DUF4230 domain-containing protein [Spirochaetia bacterium]
MKKILLLMIVTVILFSTIAAVLLFTNTSLTALLPNFQIIRTETRTHSEIMLTQIRSIFQIHTVQYIYETVFPFDFVPANVNWPSILSTAGRNLELLTDQEREYLEVYRMAQEYGLSLLRNPRSFVVVTSIITAGFDISEDSSGEITITEEEDRILITLPNAEIVHSSIEDFQPDSYPYPEFHITPGNWQQLSGVIQSHAEARAIEEGILETAERRGRTYIQDIFNGTMKEVEVHFAR